MNKIIMLLESIKESNYVMEKNYDDNTELRISDYKSNEKLLIEFSHYNINLWVFNKTFDCWSYQGTTNIKDIIDLIKKIFN